ncbi:MAG: hypothetical protein HY840_01065, partial [Bacteroidetes bacterium]|nr:hypothetical protein [Bacteroidota bacterium]
AISNITTNSASSGGNITTDNGLSVTARGVCWSTSSNPVATGSHTSDGTGTGNFTSSITGLSAATTYYVRTYATNLQGTYYGNQLNFNTSATTPTVTTNSVTNVVSATATCGGNVTSSGGATVTARGVCWNTSQNPTTSSNHTTDGSGTGTFTSSITGLSPGTTYYVRAYATNSVGTAYGYQISFYTPTHDIGESYQGGIIAYILQFGDPGFVAGQTHGLIAAPSDQSTGAEWGCNGTTITGADGTALGTGNQNTIDIVAGCTTAGIAARLCSDLVLGGYSDWYLPCKD